MLAFALMGHLLLGPHVPPADDTFDRGRGLYIAGATIPEPPIGLALVILGAAGMRLRERRRQQIHGSRAGR